MTEYELLESDEQEQKKIAEGLCAYNRRFTANSRSIPHEKLNRHIKDESGKIIAGINSECVLDCTCITALWVDKDYRNKGLGSQLLAYLEDISRYYGIDLIRLDTFDSQAKKFYLEHGYEIIGSIKNCPKGQELCFLKKELHKFQ